MPATEATRRQAELSGPVSREGDEPDLAARLGLKAEGVARPQLW
jgi:hypothetical protein